MGCLFESKLPNIMTDNNYKMMRKMYPNIVAFLFLVKVGECVNSSYYFELLSSSSAQNKKQAKPPFTLILPLLLGTSRLNHTGRVRCWRHEGFPMRVFRKTQLR